MESGEENEKPSAAGLRCPSDVNVAVYHTGLFATSRTSLRAAGSSRWIVRIQNPPSYGGADAEDDLTQAHSDRRPTVSSGPVAVPFRPSTSFLFLLLATGVAGAALFSFRIGPLVLFPFRLLFPVLLAVFYIGNFEGGNRLDISHVKVRNHLTFLGLWLIYAIVSLAWTESYGDAIEEIAFLLMIVAVVGITVHMLRTLDDLDRFYRFWLLVLVAIASVGIWEVATGHHLPSSKSNELFFDRDTPTCVFRNPNDFATVLTLCLPFAVTWMSHAKSLLQRILGLGIILATLQLILETGSRANMIGVLLGAAFWFTFLLPARKKVATVLALGAAVILLAMLPTVRLGDNIAEIGKELGTIDSENIETSGTSLNVRVNLISNSLRLVVDTFGFGVGAGNIEYRIARDYAENTLGIINVHNWWVEILANYGLFVFIGYVVFFLSLLLGLIKAHRRLTSVRQKRICEALIFGLVAFSVASTSSSSVMTLRPQWFFFAFVLSFLNYCRIKASEIDS